jgi:carboxyl-terminal processing protease
VAFKTKGGREVFDGSGLDPDYKFDRKNITVLDALDVNEFLFEYANVFCSRNAPPTDLKTFALTDKDYEEFLQWLKSSTFSYSTELELQVKDMEAEGARTRDEEVQAAIRSLKEKVIQSKNADLIRYKTEIVKALEQEISFHYNQFPGRFQATGDTDEELQQAIKVLMDPMLYKGFLQPK